MDYRNKVSSSIVLLFVGLTTLVSASADPYQVIAGGIQSKTTHQKLAILCQQSETIHPCSPSQAKKNPFYCSGRTERTNCLKAVLAEKTGGEWANLKEVSSDWNSAQTLYLAKFFPHEPLFTEIPGWSETAESKRVDHQDYTRVRALLLEFPTDGFSKLDPEKAFHAEYALPPQEVKSVVYTWSADAAFGKGIKDSKSNRLLQFRCITGSFNSCRAVGLFEKTGDQWKLIGEEFLIPSPEAFIRHLKGLYGPDETQAFFDQNGWNWSSEPVLLKEQKYNRIKNAMLASVDKPRSSYWVSAPYLDHTPEYIATFSKVDSAPGFQTIILSNFRETNGFDFSERNSALQICRFFGFNYGSDHQPLLPSLFELTDLYRTPQGASAAQFHYFATDRFPKKGMSQEFSHLTVELNEDGSVKQSIRGSPELPRLSPVYCDGKKASPTDLGVSTFIFPVVSRGSDLSLILNLVPFPYKQQDAEFSNRVCKLLGKGEAVPGSMVNGWRLPRSQASRNREAYRPQSNVPAYIYDLNAVSGKEVIATWSDDAVVASIICFNKL